MSEILHANIFFIIASVATVCFCILVSIALYHLIKILRLFRSIMERIDAESELIAEDIAHFRSFVAEGSFISRVIGFAMGAHRSAGKKSRNSKDINND